MKLTSRYLFIPIRDLFSILFIVGTALSIQELTAQEKKTAEDKTIVKILSTDEFESAIKKENNPQIVDTRLPEEYEYNHLINAININEKQTDYTEKKLKLDKNNPVFAYAIGNGRSTQLAKELSALSYKTIFILNGGIGGWIGKGKPIFSSVKDNFTLKDLKKITDSNSLVLIDLHTRYCPACRKLQPTVDSLSSDTNPKLKIVKIDVYDHPVIGSIFNIDALPTLILIHNGKESWRKTGAGINKKDINDEIFKELKK